MNIHVVQPGDTIESIADLYGVNVSRLIQDNGLNNIIKLVPGQTIVIVYPTQTYTVKEGDSLESIADSNGISIMQLLRNNPFLSDREYIYPGETLVISYPTGNKITTNGFSYPFIDKNVLRKTLPYLTYLTVYNYRATKEGVIATFYDDTELIQITKEYGAAPLVMLTTMSLKGEADLEVAFELLLNEEFQDIQLNNLIEILKTKGYSGVNIVFNYMTTSNEYLYLNFITKASNRLKSEGYLIFLTINPNIKTVNNGFTFEKINFSNFSQVVDGIIFLQFIWGTNPGPPAPVSSIYNIKTFVDYAITLVPPDKFILGKPVIAYDWGLPYLPGYSSAYSLTIDVALSLARDFGVTIQFDEASQTPYFNYIQPGIGYPIEHIVWSIDARSFEALTSLVAEERLGGTGIWSIMVFTPQLWLLLNSEFEIIKILPVKSIAKLGEQIYPELFTK